MSKIPEKKVLKEMLEKLKAKVIGSQSAFLGLSTSMGTSMTQSLQETSENVLKMPEGKEKMFALLILSMFNTWNNNFNLLNITVGALLSDMNLYIETLERYSTELDSTLTDIFEGAKKMAEEQRKKQEELKKKKPPYGV